MFKNVHYITAGAGAGKTTELVNIITRLVGKENASPERMILTTFTEAAATEFREKSKAALPPEKAIAMNAAKMGTLHSIASTYIHRYWYLLGLSPSVKPMSKSMSAILMNRSLEDVVKGEEAAIFNRYVETFGIIKKSESGYDYDFWKTALKDLFSKMREYGFGKEWIPEFRDNTLALLRSTFEMKRNLTVYSTVKPVFDRYLSYESIVSQHANDTGQNQFAKNKAQIQTILNLNMEEIDLKTLDLLRSYKWGNKVTIPARDPVKDQYDPLLEKSHSEIKEATACLSKHLVPKEYNLICTVTVQMFDILGAWMDAYSKIKDENGVIDYADMEEKFYQLLQRKEVLEDIEKSIDYLFVDEFQDSSPIQAKIYDIISNHIKQSWFVGDRKQAIYGFAGSDAGLIGELAQAFPKEKGDASSSTGFAKDSFGNSSQILRISHRSVPGLVVAAKKIFTAAFGVSEPDSPLDQIPADQVELQSEEGKTNHSWECLYHLTLEGDNATARTDALATVLCQMIEDDRFKKAGYTPSDIAILTRWKYDVKAIATALRRKGIRTAAIDPDGFRDTPEVVLILDILKLSAGIDTAKSRAEIRKVLSDEELADLAERIKAKDNTLNDFPTLEEFAKTLRTLSVADRIDEIVSRFDLYGICRLWDSPEARRCNINLLRQAAAEYTDQSLMLCSSADVRGFLIFLNAFKADPKFDNSADGVKVLTCHKAKGLDWKIVVLYSLDDYKEEKDLSGVMIIGKRSAPDRLLVIPRLPEKDWVSDCLDANPKSAELLRQKRAAQRGEERRLLYVGFTRAKDVVITAATSATPGVIDTLCPTSKKREEAPDAGHVDIWGIGLPSAFCNATEDPTLMAYNGNVPLRFKNAGFFLPKKEEKEEKKSDPKYLSPSKYKDKDIQAAADVETAWDFGARTDIAHPELDDNEFGDCLHHLFAVCEPGKHALNLAAAERTLKAFGIDDTKAAEKTVGAIEGFFGWLSAEYGTVVSLDREVPFQYSDDKGHVFSGNMDLVWRTEKGAVLVDFKTFPGKRSDLFDKHNKHWAGKYASQLDIYARALESLDNCAPLDRLLFYPIEGLVIRVK